ncbi:DUF1128 domain-containing protein [Bacillus kwashiorkori]|uniref:DUF1128 domain-containing protein n=1 Tax=Bacillus kwashiorkori TaxID=1522318 RepID=UPI0007854807|nr:DUF1128 domain-containing protein [Bacillus kwashiorkori]
MDLSVKSQENMEYMVKKILEKLKIINLDAVKSSQISEEKYDDVLEIYYHVMKRDIFSPSEMQALAEELGNLRQVK